MFLYLKAIAFAISLYNTGLPFFGAVADAMLHADDPVVFTVINVLEHILIIDLTCSGLVPAGIVAAVESSYFAPCGINVRDQVPFGDLLVIDIIYNLAGWSVNSPADCIRLPRSNPPFLPALAACVC